MSTLASPAVAAEIQAADDERVRCKSELDFDGLARVLADELIYIHSHAHQDNKESLTGGFKSGRIRFIRVTRSDVVVRSYGEMALMSGKVVTEFDMRGKTGSAFSAFVSAWVKRDGRWQMAHYQSTSIPPTPAR